MARLREYSLLLREIRSLQLISLGRSAISTHGRTLPVRWLAVVVLKLFRVLFCLLLIIFEISIRKKHKLLKKKERNIVICEYNRLVNLYG